MDGARDFVHRHPSGRQEPGEVPQVDAGEDVPHLVALDGSQSGSAEDAGELGTAWAVWVAREMATRQMREERACFLRERWGASRELSDARTRRGGGGSGTGL